MERVIFWNNKGGTGKTTLTFQIINEYAFQNPENSAKVSTIIKTQRAKATSREAHKNKPTFPPARTIHPPHT